MANNNWNFDDQLMAEQEAEYLLENTKLKFINSPTPETLAALQALQPNMGHENPDAFIMYEVLPEAVDNDWADVVEFIFQFFDLDPVTLERPDIDINTNNYGAPVGVPTMDRLYPSDGSYDTLKLFVEQALRKGHTLEELEDLYGYIEFFDEIKQETIEYIENERAKLMYLRKATPSLPNNVLFGYLQSYMTEKPVFNKEREMRARRTNPFPMPANRANNTNNATRKANKNKNGNRWAPSIIQSSGPAKRIRKKKHTHRKKKRPLFRKSV
jgi:hypothetical protein